MTRPKKVGNELGFWLPVEKVANQYVETNPDGTINKYKCIEDPVEILIEQYKVLRTVDIESGLTKIEIRGQTTDYFGAIGVTDEFPIFDVCISTLEGKLNASIIKEYWHMGHSQSSKFHVNISIESMAVVINLLETLRYPQKLLVKVDGGAFYLNDSYRVNEKWNKVYYLPWIEDLTSISSATQNKIFGYFPKVLGIRLQAAHSSSSYGDLDKEQSIAITNSLKVDFATDVIAPIAVKLEELKSSIDKVGLQVVQIPIGLAVVFVAWQYFKP